ncbi:TonB-dependent receptor domain-containing protein [Chitinophaga japonensis]|uniref:Outer membrane receptor protein involved in Fe transport n=1 Tax=Chitinophaga japonensis TaxID=104662 RepID=A0A562T296_CHIJA|nr:TonB-dependent receptor [Chitinophaga japonensis]TWI86900.1 outer membrane receptor protein involved in Fe transport [Chitinophaga japonensis]
MKNRILALLTILSCPFFAHAQHTAAIHVTGQVADSVTRQPLAYATVTLLQAASRRPVMNTLTDEQGHFSLAGVSPGRYTISIRLNGYTPLLLKAFTADSLHPRHTLPTSYLQPATRQLQAVTVTGQKPLLEIKDDRLVYNVEQDLNKDALSAAEMLRRVPLVTVDPDGNIRLKGSSSFKVLLNGKSTSVIARNPAEALHSFPASVINSIEVITEPSARYDAEGAAGIINIITRPKFSGHNGTLYGNYNTRGFAYGGGTLNIKAGKLGIASYMSANYYRNKGRSDGRLESYVPGNRTTLLQSGTSTFDGSSLNGNLELSYDLDSSSSLSVYGNVDISRNSTRSQQLNLLHDSLAQRLQTGQYTAFPKYRRNSYDAGLDYQKKFRQPARTLSLSLNLNAGDNSLHSDNTQNNDPGGYVQLFNNNNEQHTETTIQLDYSHPLPHQQLLETGAKAIFRTIESDFSQLVKEEPGIFRENPGRSNAFHYGQDVLAFYTTYRFKVKEKLNVLLGARLEHTSVNARFISGNTSLDNDYLNFVPTANISLALNAQQAIAFSYSRRLQRPWVWSLNPYVDDSDPNNITFGNPDLEPEFSHTFGLRYNGLLKEIRLTASADHTLTTNAMEPYVTIDTVKGFTSSTYANIGRRSATGFNLSTGWQPTARWNLHVNLRVMYTALRGYASLHNTGWSASSYASTGYDLGKGMEAEASAQLNSSQPTLQGRTPGYVTSTFTLRKSLFREKATAGLHIDQPFQQEIAWRSKTGAPLFYRAHTFYYPVRAVRISFNWKFGQLKTSVSRKKGVNNNDIKQRDGSKP